MKTDLMSKIKSSAEITERALKFYLSGDDKDIQVLIDAERYSVMSGGKRVRPFIVLEVCRMFGGSEEAAIPFAAAVELMHSSSLIHDDLPCMDDDDFRRGKPSCHKAFGEANALLAGDSLMMRAFGVCASNDKVPPETARKAVEILAENVGRNGMVGGQVIDLATETQKIDFDLLLKLHAMKTGALIKTAAAFGCLAAGVGTESEEYKAVIDYAEKIGLVFQIIDDILDMRSGELDEKTTFMTFMNEDEALKYAKDITEQAIARIAPYKNHETLEDLALYLLGRDA